MLMIPVASALALVVAAANAANPAPPPPGAAPVANAPGAAVVPFRVVVLGAQGGLEDGDLTSFYVEHGGKRGVLLDAGTLVHGIEVARKKGAFTELSTAAVLKERIGSVFITHPHFDHTMGLIIGSPDDVNRKVYGLSPTIDALRDHVFNGITWANFGTDGAGAIGRYQWMRMAAGSTVKVEDAGVDVTALPLAHAGGVSTAFVVDGGDAAVIYCGDTGPDDVEKTDALGKVLAKAAPFVRGHKLAAIFIEASYPSARDDGKLFGHLTPKHVMNVVHALARNVDLQHPDAALKGLTIVVTHVKPALDGSNPRSTIVGELEKMNDAGVRFVVPQQGDVLTLSPP